MNEIEKIKVYVNKTREIIEKLIDCDMENRYEIMISCVLQKIHDDIAKLESLYEQIDYLKRRYEVEMYVDKEHDIEIWVSCEKCGNYSKSLKKLAKDMQCPNPNCNEIGVKLTWVKRVYFKEIEENEDNAPIQEETESDHGSG